MREANNLCSFYRITQEEPKFDKLNVCSKVMMNKINLEMYADIIKSGGGELYAQKKTELRFCLIHASLQYLSLTEKAKIKNESRYRANIHWRVSTMKDFI